LIDIEVDGFPERVPARSSIAQLIERFQVQHKDLLVEHNGRFVAPKDYGVTKVKAGDRLEFILPAFGG
jgi:thiamine biosynthesis protein ThiS